MAGQQGQQLPSRLNQDFRYIVGVDDFNFADPVGQRLPQVCDRNQIPDFQLVDVAKVAGTVVAPVSGNDAVGVLAANGQAGLAQMGGSIRHVLFRCAEKDGHFQLHNGNGNHTEHLIRKAVIR